MNALEQILASTRQEVRRRREELPFAELEKLGQQRLEAEGHRSFARALRGPELALIAEHKAVPPAASSQERMQSPELAHASAQRGQAA